MSFKRLKVELENWTPRQGVELLESPQGRASPLAWSLSVTAHGKVFFLNVDFPDDYPFRPPKITMDKFAERIDRAALDERFRLVCPELWCWGLSHDGEIRLAELTDHWSPALHTTHLINHVALRLQCPSFVQFAASDVLEKLPRLTEAPAAAAKVSILFGTAGEAPAVPDGTDPHLFILVDPAWIPPLLFKRRDGLPSNNEFETIHVDEQLTEDSGIHWKGIGSNRNAHYIVVAAPFCYNEQESQEAMKKLIQGLDDLGWKNVDFQQSGISLRVPEGMPPITEYNPRRESWEGVPWYLRRLGIGETPGNYGGSQDDVSGF